MLRPDQIRAARTLLGWSRIKLATRMGVTEKAVSAFESGGQWREPINLDFVRGRLEAAGVIFVEENGEGPGVQLRQTQ
jgi:transcriptional regulator with XRE-family HTH domain